MRRQLQGLEGSLPTDLLLPPPHPPSGMSGPSIRWRQLGVYFCFLCFPGLSLFIAPVQIRVCTTHLTWPSKYSNEQSPGFLGRAKEQKEAMDMSQRLELGHQHVFLFSSVWIRPLIFSWILKTTFLSLLCSQPWMCNLILTNRKWVKVMLTTLGLTFKEKEQVLLCQPRVRSGHMRMRTVWRWSAVGLGDQRNTRGLSVWRCGVLRLWWPALPCHPTLLHERGINSPL